MTRTLRRAARWLGAGAAGGMLAGCALIAGPPQGPVGVAERLAAFPTRGLPLRGAVTIRWSDRQIPFVEAEHDEDAAFALGLVHAHLRLGQMALARTIAYGRISEAVGPIAVDIDRALRILSFPRAAAASERAMDPAARRWTQAFVDGVNHYQKTMRDPPHEFRALGLDREPWTVADVLTVGRLVGTDVNWLVWLDLLALRGRAGWPELWARLLESGQASTPSFSGAAGALGALLGGVARSGSNSLALAPSRTATGGAILANDPHLGITVPNLWLVAGVRSPSYRAVGLMGPGLPVFAIGRTPRIAWGGTNMRAASSDLVDVSGLPDSAFSERRERIRVRWWFDAEAVVRETPWGPVVTDAPQLADSGLPPAALKWTGHAPSDEIGAMLAVMRARDFSEFRAAFAAFAVPGQNMLYADADGNIGQVMAVRLPARSGPPPDLVVPPERAAAWDTMLSAADLPFALNPGEGFLASANNRPAAAGPPVGFFFSSDDRVRRMADIAAAEAPMDLADVAALQRDARMISAGEARDLFVARLDSSGLAASAGPRAAEALRRLREWDGRHRAESVGAVTYEQFRHGFVRAFYPAAFGAEDGAAFAAVDRIAMLLPEHVAAADEEAVRAALAAGLAAAAEGLDAYATWADMHRLRLSHPLAAAPVVGGRYRFAEYGVGGSSQTLMKTAHDASGERHFVQYGANARHISDMTDPDANYFVLLGGQDGWLGSSTLLDQWPLWRDGDYVRAPLTPEAVRAAFPRVMTLEAGG